MGPFPYIVAEFQRELRIWRQETRATGSLNRYHPPVEQLGYYLGHLETEK